MSESTLSNHDNLPSELYTSCIHALSYRGTDVMALVVSSQTSMAYEPDGSIVEEMECHQD